jgi:thymidylate synthase
MSTDFINKITTDENKYLNLLKYILENGEQRDDRTGTGTISVFGQQIKFDISESVPLLTTKKMGWKTIIEELLWFLRGDTNANHLKEKGVTIWDGNTSRTFLDSRGLTEYPEGDIGAGYGFQWRHFGAEYKTCNFDYNNDENNRGFDQIEYVLNELRTNPTSRRIYMSAWNPAALDKMALPPCHVSVQFYVNIDKMSGEKYLSCHMYQRSVDMFLGFPFNIFSYTVLTYILAKKTGMKPKELIISTGDTHIYRDHIEQVKIQVTRSPFKFPTLTISDSIIDKDFNDITINEFKLNDYIFYPAIKAPMAV